MKSVESVFPPDPLYDHQGEPYPERAWIIVTRGKAEAVGEVIVPDFRQRLLKEIHNESLLSKSLKDVKPQEIEAFIKNYYLLFSGVDHLGESELEAMEVSIHSSALYRSSKEAAHQYISSLLASDVKEEKSDDRGGIFFGGFLDKYLLERITNRKKLLEVEVAIGREEKESVA